MSVAIDKNFVIAYRKSVRAGEVLEVQVLNIPDGTQPKGDVSDVRGWQFGPLIGGLGATPGKADYFPGEIRSLSVRLR